MSGLLGFISSRRSQPNAQSILDENENGQDHKDQGDEESAIMLYFTRFDGDSYLNEVHFQSSETRLGYLYSGSFKARFLLC